MYLLVQEQKKEVAIIKRRDPLMVVVLSIVTLGIYALVWYVQTKSEMNA